ncbi:unnamed protein product [Peronospora belbahrii]|uniref:Jacalin-type lectin domain-containing protein n=1 Tax=Peronospora belbahrii TaxID=622444 RepID=A0AAU9KPR0_9STRA|nr:unnamed protein product [Peronospora belbahrii]
MLRTRLAFCLLLVYAHYVVVTHELKVVISSDDFSSSNTTASSSLTTSENVSNPAKTFEPENSLNEPKLSYTLVPEITLNFPIDGTEPPNWVGPSIGDFIDTACYRKKYKQNSRGECPLGYDVKRRKCWAQCPISYPVQCFSECIPQNDDCTLEIMAKITNPGYVVLNIATAGVFGAIYTSFKTAKTGVMCAFSVFNVAEGISRFMRNRRLTTPNGTQEELLGAVFQTDMFLVDLPVAMTACMGYTVPSYAPFADAVVTAAETFVKQLVMNHNMIMSSANAFMSFFRNTTAGKSVKNLDAQSVASLTSMINSGSSCGFNLKRLTDRVIAKIADIRDEDPCATNEDIRTEMIKSSIILQDVPTVTNKCMGELLKKKKPYVAYQTRDTLRKTFGVIVDQLIASSTTDMGKAMARKDYMVATSNLGLLVLSALDPTGIAYMTFNYVQSVCGPTEFIGEIDDGNLRDALGLTIMDEAFLGSEGMWTKKGDGIVKITFTSHDIKDVTVVIHSGGKKFDSVYVCQGETVIWTTTVKALQDKTMYLTRKRPGFLGIPNSNGGSLLLWVPRSSEGGHLEMNVDINVS